MSFSKLLSGRFTLCAFLILWVPWSSVYGIIGGKKVSGTQWPNVVNIVDYSIFNGNDFHFLECSGVIVHPRLVLTAAHCLEEKESSSFVRVYMGPGSADGSVTKSFPIDRFAMHPEYKEKGDKWDFAYLLMEDDLPISQEQIILPFSSRLERLEALGEGNYDITIVGYGDRQPFGSSEKISGEKYGIDTFFDDVYIPHDETMFYAGEKNHGPLGGDSGAPIFYKMASGEWRILSLVQISGSNSQDYAIGESMYLDYAIDWIQDDSGIRLFSEDPIRKIVRFSFIPKGKVHDPTQCSHCDGNTFFKYAYSFKNSSDNVSIDILGESLFVRKKDFEEIQAKGYLDQSKWQIKLIYTDDLDAEVRFIHWRGWWNFPHEGEEVEDLRY